MDDDKRDDKVRIVLPDEKFTIIEYKQNNLPCIAAVNAGLLDFQHREIFRWHLSVIIDFEEIVENGMPSKEERQVVDLFCDALNEAIKAGGNALFLIRETWNQTRRLVWMVYDPEIANLHLQYIIENNKHPRQFDYQMQEDFDWQKSVWYLNSVRR